MTSFAFIAGLLPLVVATGAGAIGNRTIGTAAAGGMLTGTVIGVLVIPGLYYLFGRIADKRSLIKDEADAPLSEIFERRAQEARDRDSDRLQHPVGAAVLYSQSPLPDPAPPLPNVFDEAIGPENSSPVG
jgi:HAE1 family hydrophobic/amphiphilic exporter-1